MTAIGANPDVLRSATAPPPAPTRKSTLLALATQTERSLDALSTELEDLKRETLELREKVRLVVAMGDMLSYALKNEIFSTVGGIFAHRTRLLLCALLSTPVENQIRVFCVVLGWHLCVGIDVACLCPKVESCYCWAKSVVVV